MASRKFLGQIQSNVDEGLRRGVGSTPTFFIGSRKVATAISYDQFKRHVDDAIAQARSTKAPATKSP
jgi:protein-disulfide isomerase